MESDIGGLDMSAFKFKLFMSLYVDDIVFFADSAEQLQESLDVLPEYCARWKLTVNVSKIKIMVFRKRGSY